MGQYVCVGIQNKVSEVFKKYKLIGAIRVWIDG